MYLSSLNYRSSTYFLKHLQVVLLIEKFLAEISFHRFNNRVLRGVIPLNNLKTLSFSSQYSKLDSLSLSPSSELKFNLNVFQSIPDQRLINSA